MNMIWVIGGIVAAIVVMAVIGLVLRRRAGKNDRPDGTDDIYPMW